MRTLALILVVSLGLLTACGGGGGGGGGSDVRLDGWWELRTPLPTSTDPYAFLFLGPAVQSGPDVRYVGLDWTFDGSALRAGDPDFASPDRDEYRLTLQSSDLLEGDLVHFDADRALSARGIRLRRRATPTGVVTGTGTVGGPVDWSCVTAYAVVTEQAAGGGFTDHVVSLVDAGPDAWTTLTFEFQLGGVSIYPIALDVVEQAEVEYARGENLWSATDGEVVFTERDPEGHVRGSYDLTFAGGGSLTGEFDVPVHAVR